MTRWPGWSWATVPSRYPPEGWTTVTVKAASLNHHDVWTLRGVGVTEDRLPIVLGCDAAGLDHDGNPVVVHAVIGDAGAYGGDETLDPRRSLLSERYDGTFAERVAVPRRNLLPKPDALSFAEAACLPTAYLTAYRMLFAASGARARRDRPGPGRGRRRGHRSHPARPRGRVPGLGDQPQRGQARPGGRARRRPGVPGRRAAARAGGRGDGDRRPGHLAALAARAQAGRPHRGLRRDQRSGALCRPGPGVLPAALRDRLDDGLAGPARQAAAVLRADRECAR